MATAHAQLTLDYFAVSKHAAPAVSAYCGLRPVQYKPMRMVPEPIKPNALEVIPVFVGIAG